MSQVNINSRARQILAAITQEYLATGEAVGSRTVTRRYGVDLSPATVRNVMTDLEELGLIRQPHTSAGRIPTALGLRFFVDSLLTEKVRQLSPRDREDLASRHDFSTLEIDAALRESSRVLSEMSQHTVVLMMPRIDAEVLKHIEFLRVRDDALLAVLVSTSGRVQNKLVPLRSEDGPLREGDLDRIHQYLNDKLDGRTLQEVRRLVEEELAGERVRYDALAQRALRLQQQALPDPEERPDEGVYVTGQANLIGHLLTEEPPPDPARLKGLLRALEDRRLLVRLLEETEAASGLKVFIGAETAVPELSEQTVVAASYTDGARPVGALGVIGPTRMNYSRVIALVDFTAQLLSSVITHQK
jgi:heat-inducible transcriptional repressor